MVSGLEVFKVEIVACSEAKQRLTFSGNHNNIIKSLFDTFLQTLAITDIYQLISQVVRVLKSNSLELQPTLSLHSTKIYPILCDRLCSMCLGHTKTDKDTYLNDFSVTKIYNGQEQNLKNMLYSSKTILQLLSLIRHLKLYILLA